MEVRLQAEVDLQSFKKLAARERPAVTHRVDLAKQRLKAQQQRELELQDRYKGLTSELADLHEQLKPAAQ